MSQRSRPRTPSDTDPDVAGEQEQPASEPTGWWRWHGPYPIVLVTRALEVVPGGDPVHSPDGPPTTSPDWRPAPPPKE